MTNPYAFGQLATAFTTATTHDDPEIRRRADLRAHQWFQTIDAIRTGRVAVGSRTPVAGFPAWVTLTVARGGFATGEAAAETPSDPDEIARAEHLRITPTRSALFRYWLTDEGIDELWRLLDSGEYRVDVPEDAALLTVAWLLRSEAPAGAFDVLDAITPFSDRLRFAPKRASASTEPPDHVHRLTARQAADALRARTPKIAVETQREALAVWNPFGDRLLSHWLERFDDDGRLAVAASPLWIARSSALADEYATLAQQHTLCTKHRNPRQNLAVMIRMLGPVVSGADLSPREVGQLETSVNAAVRKRGIPGSTSHATLRSAQLAVAAAPSHSRLAAVVAERLDTSDPIAGLADPALFVGGVDPAEAYRHEVEPGSPMPAAVRRIVARARSSTIRDLLDRGVVPSAEVLAELTPQLTATVMAAPFGDESLARLAAADYRAFRRRRSLLLTNFAKQVQFAELPWVQAVQAHAVGPPEQARAVATLLGSLALDHFPSTLLPNALIREIAQLMASAGTPTPLVEELAADIFMGQFSDKFRQSAVVAADVLGDSLYTRYYAIDWNQVRRLGPESTMSFSELCRRRSASPPSNAGWSVAANGMVIEQAQILTTHNLAVLVANGVRPTRAWTDLANDAITRVSELFIRASRQERRLPTIKDAAYSWRQAVFYLSLAEPEAATEAINNARSSANLHPLAVDLVDTVAAVCAGASNGHEPFVGWTVGRHWVEVRL